MTLYLLVKTVHIVSATILFGTGIGIAFFMARSHFTDDLRAKSFAIRTTVLADALFTAPAVIVQPATGAWLLWSGGYRWTEPWLLTSYCLYLLAGLCWLPVVWIQIRLARIVSACLSKDEKLPPLYHRLFWTWFILGWPAFAGLIAIFFLMVAKRL